VVRIFRILTGLPDVVSGWKFRFSNRRDFHFLKFADKKFKQPNYFIEHVCLPYTLSETDDSRFNSREKHMLKTQFSHIYDKRIIDFTCSVCTVKYQVSFFALTSLPILKNLGLIFHSTDLTLGQ
jgi:hypothetical protein